MRRLAFSSSVLTRLGRNAWLSLGSAALVVFLLAMAVLGGVLDRSQAYADALDSVTPRYARLLGIQGEAEGVHLALETSRAQLGRLAYPSTMPADRVGADVQQKLRGLAEAAGFAVVSSQLGSVDAEEMFEVIPLVIRVEGSLESLQSLLRGVEALEPVVELRALTISAIPRRVAGVRDLRIDIIFESARLNS